MLNEVTVLNIREYLAATENGRFGEEELKELLSEFSCSKRNESQSEEIAKIDSVAKSSVTETPGKAPKKGSAGSFLRPIPGDKSAATYSFFTEVLTRPFPAPVAHCAGYPSASIFHAYNRG